MELTIPASPSDPVREVAVLVAKTKSTAVAERIVKGDPLMANYNVDAGSYSVSAENTDGVRYWYVTLDMGVALGEPFLFFRGLRLEECSRR